VRRLVQLYAGLVLFGISMAFFVQARLGVMPWDVLHQGIVRTLARAHVPPRSARSPSWSGFSGRRAG
jgi:hypothetical protein